MSVRDDKSNLASSQCHCLCSYVQDTGLPGMPVSRSSSSTSTTASQPTNHPFSVYPCTPIQHLVHSPGTRLLHSPLFFLHTLLLRLPTPPPALTGSMKINLASDDGWWCVWFGHWLARPARASSGGPCSRDLISTSSQLMRPVILLLSSSLSGCARAAPCGLI